MPSQLEVTLQSLLGDAYHIRRELHGAGMSRVFVAYEPALKREVVVKVLPPDLRSRSSVARFRQEIEVTAQLQHPHILPVIGAGGDERLLYYITPFVAGGSLRDRIATSVVPLDEGVTFAAELLGAVAFAHARGILHRDIKPGNVLLSQGHAVLADFGIAGVLEALHEVDIAGSTSVASPEAYRAPERPTGAAADLYAIAVLTYEMVTRALPKPGVGESAIAEVVAGAHPEAPPERIRGFAQAMSRALSRDPGARYATAGDFRVAMLGADARRPRKGVAFAAALAGVAAALIWWISRDSTAPIENAVGPATRVEADTKLTGSERPPLPVITFADTATTRRTIAAPPPVDSEAVRARDRLRFALSSAWVGLDAAAVERSAREALAARESGKLDRREQLLVDGVVALAAREYPTACAAFDSALVLQQEYHGWMGAGECRQRDSRVIVSGDSATFRSSFHQAALAYAQAARSAPDGETIAFERLPSVAFTERGRVRMGTAEDGRAYLGRAVAVGDSFTFLAFRPGPVRMTPGNAEDNARAAAISRNMLRPILIAWSRREPANARARIRLVELLEASGNIREPGTDRVTAYDEVEAARKLEVNPRDRVRLAQTHVRILLRAREFARAARIADSVLDANPSPTPVDAESLISLAFLTGKVSRGATLLEMLSGSPARQIRLPDGQFLDLAPSVIRERAAFLTAATLGVCTPEVRAAPARLASMLDALFPAGQRPRGVEGAFLERPLVLATPCLGVEQARVIREITNPLLGAIIAADPEARARWKQRYAAMTAARSIAEPGYESSESAYGEAMGYLVAGDSASAFMTLRRVLDAMPALPIGFLNNEIQAGTLTRDMALAADLAHALGKDDDAGEWAAAVAALWANADPELRQTANRMRKLAETIDSGRDGFRTLPRH